MTTEPESENTSELIETPSANTTEIKQYVEVKENIKFIYLDEKRKILHCPTGPAVVWLSNNVGYHYLYNKYYTKEEFERWRPEKK